MPIQYAEGFIIVKQNTFFNYFNSFIGNDISFCDEDTIILSFDKDGFVCDTNDMEYKHIECGPCGLYSVFPTYFSIESKCFLMKTISLVDGVRKMNFSEIFKNNPKYKNNGIASIYNVIYHSVENVDAFSIIKIKSSNKTPQFLIAYDDNYVNRDQIIYLVNYLLKNHF